MKNSNCFPHTEYLLIDDSTWTDQIFLRRVKVSHSSHLLLFILKKKCIVESIKLI